MNLLLTGLALLTVSLTGRAESLELKTEKRASPLGSWSLSLPGVARTAPYLAALREREKFFAGCRRPEEAALRVKAAFTIQADGKVTPPKTQATPRRDDQAESCVADLLRKTHFPRGTAVAAELSLSLPFRAAPEPEPQLPAKPAEKVPPPRFEHVLAGGVLEFFRAHDTELRDCYRQAREEAGNVDLGAGLVQLRIRVRAAGGDGKLSAPKAEIVSSTLRNKAVESCVVSVVQRSAFPGPDQAPEGSVLYPLVFP